MLYHQHLVKKLAMPILYFSSPWGACIGACCTPEDFIIYPCTNWCVSGAPKCFTVTIDSDTVVDGVNISGTYVLEAYPDYLGGYCQWRAVHVCPGDSPLGCFFLALTPANYYFPETDTAYVYWVLTVRSLNQGYTSLPGNASWCPEGSFYEGSLCFSEEQAGTGTSGFHTIYAVFAVEAEEVECTEKWITGACLQYSASARNCLDDTTPLILDQVIDQSTYSGTGTGSGSGSEGAHNNTATLLPLRGDCDGGYEDYYINPAYDEYGYYQGDAWPPCVGFGETFDPTTYNCQHTPASCVPGSMIVTISNLDDDCFGNLDGEYELPLVTGGQYGYTNTLYYIYTTGIVECPTVEGWSTIFSIAIGGTAPGINYFWGLPIMWGELGPLPYISNTAHFYGIISSSCSTIGFGIPYPGCISLATLDHTITSVGNYFPDLVQPSEGVEFDCLVSGLKLTSGNDTGHIGVISGTYNCPVPVWSPGTVVNVKAGTGCSVGEQGYSPGPDECSYCEDNTAAHCWYILIRDSGKTLWNGSELDGMQFTLQEMSPCYFEAMFTCYGSPGDCFYASLQITETQLIFRIFGMFTSVDYPDPYIEFLLDITPPINCHDGAFTLEEDGGSGLAYVWARPTWNCVFMDTGVGCALGKTDDGLHTIYSCGGCYISSLFITLTGTTASEGGPCEGYDIDGYYEITAWNDLCTYYEDFDVCDSHTLRITYKIGYRWEATPANDYVADVTYDCVVVTLDGDLVAYVNIDRSTRGLCSSDLDGSFDWCHWVVYPLIETCTGDNQAVLLFESGFTCIDGTFGITIAVGGSCGN